MTVTQGAWMREYERRRSDLDNAAYDVGAARNGEEEERAEAVAAIARKALDAHVRGLVEENERLRELLRGAEAVVLSDAAVARIIEAVEKHCGMGHGAWDMVSARDLVEGFAAAFRGAA